MGVDYSAKLMVGLPSEDMQELRDDEGYYDADGELEFVSQWYYGDEGIVGIVVKRTNKYSYSILDPQSLEKDLNTALDKFQKITNKEGKVYLCTHGW